MAATGDNLIEASQLPDSLDLRSIDHIECKIVTPEKETLSPTSPLRNTIGNGENIINALNRTKESFQEQTDLKVKVTETSDSGLDSSNSSEEGGKFVERQETQIPIGKPNSILSPDKRVGGFNFANGQNSLDAVNNNSEVDVETSQISIQPVRSESVSSECYLGLEIDLHDQKKVDRESKRSVSSDGGNGIFTETVVHEVNKESDMNLYWYRTNLDIDPFELEAFTNQNNESYVSSVQLSVGNNYYNNKLQETQKIFDTSEKQNIKPSTEEGETRERWSPAFESASSRFLDLASEMKFGSKSKADIPVEGTDVDSVQQHPWGLDSDNKVVIMPEDKIHDDSLPAVAEYVAHQMVVDQVDADVPEQDDDIDEADALGYMEMQDKDKIVKSLNSVNNNIPTKTKAFASEQSEQYPVSQTDQTLRIESEQIVSTVVQNVHSTMLKSESESTNQGHDIADGANVAMPVEEPIQCVYTETVQATLKDTSVTVPEVYDPMEVKRKFRMPADAEQKLLALGAKLVAVENLVDEYLDDDDYSLCLAECWLRLRNKRFEMKVVEDSQDSKKSFVYSETQNEMDIKQYLIQKYTSKLMDTHHDQYIALDIIVDELGFTEFVTFETVRKSYELDNCKVDLEMTDCGDQVCELEVQVDSPRKVVNALNTLNNLATRLGLKPLQGVSS